ALGKKPELLNVKFGVKAGFPSFALIKDLALPAKGKAVTLDTSGPAPQALTHPPRKPVAMARNISWNNWLASMFEQDPNCTHGCDKSGDTGSTGASGIPGDPGMAGDRPGKAPNGNCT